MRINRWSLRTLGWVAAYVLALQTILSAFAFAPIGFASNGELITLCLRNHTGDQAPPANHVHCQACVAVSPALPPPLTIEAPARLAVFTLVTPRGRPAAPHDSGRAHRPGQPRAPPFA